MTEMGPIEAQENVHASPRGAVAGTATIGPSGPTEPGQRTTALRLARLHLRLGSFGLARAELEALAGSGELDEAALLDLAEIRWRTGDLPGAGEAAAAAISAGDESVLAVVIAAEAAAASARPAEARRLAGQALARTDEPLDLVFAGMPRSTIWPHDVVERETGETTAEEPSTGRQARLAGPAVMPGTGHGARVRATVAGSASVAEGSPTSLVGEGFDPASVLASARSDLAEGRLERAAAGLALVLRVAPDRSDDVLAVLDASGDDAAAGRDVSPAIAIVRADALVELGRATDARAAYATAVRALRAEDRPSD